MNMMSHEFDAPSEAAPFTYADDIGPVTRFYRERPTPQKVGLTIGVPAAIMLATSVTAIWGFSRIEEIAKSGGADVAERIHGLETILTVVLVIIALVGIAATLALFKVIQTDIVGTNHNLSDAMRRIANGETNIVVPCRGRVDEYGTMADALESFREHAIAFEEARREKEALRGQQETQILRLAADFERTIGSVVTNVSSASVQLNTTASDWARNAELSNSETERVVAASQEASVGSTAAATASDEFAMSIGEISRQAATSAELARAAANSADEADSAISNLSASAEQVGQIVELIQSIAQRTNLLALNASIEAARGGETGRGFAVVASEVKELATQTSKATEEVAAQIRAMQDSTGASVSVLRSLNKQIQQLETTAISIATAVDQQSVAGQDLARSIDIAARSTDEVAERVGKVRDMTASTGSAATQVRQSSDELASQAKLLRGHVDTFLKQIRS